MLSHRLPAESMRACRSRYDVVQLVEPRLHFGHAFAQLAFETARRTVEDVFVGGGLLAFVFRVEVVGIRFEEDAEDVAVALREVVHHRRQRVVSLDEGRVFAAQAVGRVLELVLDGRVEEQREPDVVEHGDARPYEEMDRRAYDVLFAALTLAKPFQVLFFRPYVTFSKFVSRMLAIRSSYSAAVMSRLK